MAEAPDRALAWSRFRARDVATCNLCDGGFTRNDPPIHYGKVTTDGCVKTDIYHGIAHRMCIDQANADLPNGGHGPKTLAAMGLPT